MSLIRIYGLFLRHFFLITRSFPRILDLIYWPTIQIFLWGFISKFFTLNSSYFENTVGIILSNLLGKWANLQRQSHCKLSHLLIQLGKWANLQRKWRCKLTHLLKKKSWRKFGGNSDRRIRRKSVPWNPL